MSAAEKLEALGTLTLENEHGVPIRSLTVAEQLVDVLPQIVAVTFWAEQTIQNFDEHGEVSFIPLIDALEELDKALS